MDEYAQMLLDEGADATLGALRLKYPKKTVLRNVVRKVRNTAIAKLPPYTFDEHALRAGAGLRRFASLSRQEQLREQLLLRKGGKVGLAYDAHSRDKIIDAALLPRAISNFKIAPAEIAEIQRLATASVELRSENVVTLTSDSIADLYTTARAALRNPEAHDPKTVLVALALTTGRRASEILLTGGFAPAHNAHTACFSGQVKAGLRDPNRCYNIPILAPLVDVQRGLHRVRSRWPLQAGAAPGEVNRRFSSTIARAASQHLGRLDPRLGHLHAAREIYAMTTFAACDHSYSVHGWCRKVLGHVDLDQSKHYSNVTIRGDVRAVIKKFDSA